MCGGINVIIHCFNKKCKLNHQVFLAKWYAHTFRKPYNVIKFCDTAVGCSQSSPWKLQYLSFCIHRQLHVVGKKEFFKFFPLSHYPKHIFITVEPTFGEFILFEFRVPVSNVWIVRLREWKLLLHNNRWPFTLCVKLIGWVCALIMLWVHLIFPNPSK